MKKFRSKRSLIRQLYAINAEVHMLHRWFAHSEIVQEITSRLSGFTCDEWEELYVEDVSEFRSRIGLDPHREAKR